MKRRIVRSKNEYIDFVKSQNNRTNVYTTVYDFRHFSDNAKIESTVILDRIFLDFDGHDNDLDDAYADVKMVMEKIVGEDIMHTLFFSGRGFHLFLDGEPTNDIRNIQAYHRELKALLKSKVNRKLTLDDRVGQATRLRRVPNTVNMSTTNNEGIAYYCIPLEHNDLSLELEQILSLASKPRHLPFRKVGKNRAQFPVQPPLEAVGGEVSVPDYKGTLPILPCLHNAIMTENPSHMARAYLVSWYRDLLSGYRDLVTNEDKQKVLDLIVEEIKTVFGESDEVWLDWNEQETRKHARFTVFNNYNTPHCKSKLIPEGYCIGKCWRYPEEKK